MKTSHMGARKGFPLQNLVEKFVEEDLYILNRLGNVYSGRDEIHAGYEKEINNETDAEWYQAYGADVDKENTDFYINITEEFVQNVQSLLNQPIPFKRVVITLEQENLSSEQVILFTESKYFGRFPNTELIRSRPYIKVDWIDFDIILAADKKESELTIEDILFGSKGLMIDPNRTIDGYKIKSFDDDTLVLEVKQR